MGEARAAALFLAEKLELGRNVFGGLSGQFRIDGVAVRTTVATQACRNVALRDAASRDLIGTRDPGTVRLRRRCRRRQRGKMPREIGEECRVDSGDRNSHDTALAVASSVGSQTFKKIGFALRGQDGRCGAPAEPVRAVAAGTVGECAFEALCLASRRFGTAISKVAPPRLVHRRQFAQEGDHRPDFIVALLRRPGRHAGEAHAVLDDAEEFGVRPFADLAGKVRRLRQHRKDGGRPRFAGRTVADGAAAREMAGSRLNSVARQFVRHLDRECVCPHGRAHREVQEPFGHLPVAGRGTNVEEADPGCEKHRGRQDRQACRQVFPVDVHQPASLSVLPPRSLASRKTPPAR